MTSLRHRIANFFARGELQSIGDEKHLAALADLETDKAWRKRLIGDPYAKKRDAALKARRG